MLFNWITNTLHCYRMKVNEPVFDGWLKNCYFLSAIVFHVINKSWRVNCLIIECEVGTKRSHVYVDVSF